MKKKYQITPLRRKLVGKTDGQTDEYISAGMYAV
jgi:hypothetical protein